MPVFIDEIQADAPIPPDPQEHGDRIAALENRVRVLENAFRDLSTYCGRLEDACRDAFAQCPGASPFPYVQGR